MMKTGQEWLFKSLLDVIIKPMMPVLIFFAWIIASFVLVIGFLRRFSDNKGIDAEGLNPLGNQNRHFYGHHRCESVCD